MGGHRGVVAGALVPTLIAALSLALAPSPASAEAPPPVFIADAANVDRIEALAPGLVSRYFNVSTTFEFGRLSTATPNATQTATFADETKLEAAISQGTLPPGTHAVMYDDEDWSATPVAQQMDPATYYQRAADAAHTAGLLLIATPGTDLANVVNPGSGPGWKRYLSAGVAAEAARYADFYDVQAQSLEADTATYASYVQQAAQQALGANPNVSVVAGLSTNPNGHVQPASVLLAAARASQQDLRGWWLNDPVPGGNCPNCSGPYPQTVVDFLLGLSLQPGRAGTTTATTTAITPPPTITSLSQSHRRWREGAKRAQLAGTATPPIGTTFRFALNESATTRFRFRQLVPGRKVNGKCVAQTAANRTRAACKRAVPRGSLSFSASAGRHRLVFQGRLSRTRKLKPGNYRLTVTAINALGQRAARALTFTIVPG